MSIERYDPGYAGLQVFMRSLNFNTPLAQFLLKHTRFYGGRCTAFLPPDISDDDWRAIKESAFSRDPMSVEMNEPFELCIAQVIKKYFETTPAGVLLIEDCRGTPEFPSPHPELKEFDHVLSIGENAYLILKPPFPGWAETANLISAGSFFDQNAAILLQWPDVDQYLSGELPFNLEVLEHLATNADAMYVEAFDFISYVLWERGKAGTPYTANLIQSYPSDST